MREIIDEILKEEERAREVIEKAKMDAQNIILKARKDSSNLLNKTTSDLKDITVKKQKESEKSFLAEKEEILEKTKTENALLRKSREKDIAAISKKVFLQVIDIKD